MRACPALGAPAVFVSVSRLAPVRVGPAQLATKAMATDATAGRQDFVAVSRRKKMPLATRTGSHAIFFKRPPNDPARRHPPKVAARCYARNGQVASATNLIATGMASQEVMGFAMLNPSDGGSLKSEKAVRWPTESEIACLPIGILAGRVSSCPKGRSTRTSTYSSRL